MTALRKWNGPKKGEWCIPRKGSTGYDEVRMLMRAPVASKPKMNEFFVSPESSPGSSRSTTPEKAAPSVVPVKAMEVVAKKMTLRELRAQQSAVAQRLGTSSLKVNRPDTMSALS